MSDDIDVLKPDTVLKPKYAVIAKRKNACPSIVRGYRK